MTEDATVDDATPDPPPPHPLDYDQHRVVFVTLLITLGVDSALAGAIAVLNTGYGHGAEHFLGLGLWLAVAVVNAVAFVNVARPRPREFANILLAQVAVLGMAAYVLVADNQSPAPNAVVRWVATAVAVVAVWWIVWLIVTQPRASTRTFSTGWKVIYASFAVMSLFSLWLTTTYLPSTERPMVDMATSLTQEDHTAATTVLRVNITLHNHGLAAAVVVGSLYRVTYHPVVSLPFTGPAEGAVAINGPANFNLAVPSHTTIKVDDPLAEAFDLTTPNTHAFTGSAVADAGGQGGTWTNLLHADEITPMREFLLPGQTWSTETVVSVPTAVAATVRLTAQIALITDRYLGDTRACQGGTANQLSPNFLSQAHVVHAISAPAEPGDPSGSVRKLGYMCVQTRLEPQSAVADLVGAHPSIRNYYILSNGVAGQPDPAGATGTVPFLATTYQTGTGASTLAGQVRQAQAIDARNPSAVIESRSEYGVPGT